MVISHRHRYLFVELPRTGSTAIRRTLIRDCGGESILYKHATYEEFLKIASDEEKRYFVFSCIRNPLDDAVSLYFKIMTNHRNQFGSDISNGKLNYIITCVQGKRRSSRPVSFSQFFLKSYRLPYDQWSSLSHAKFDYVIRFETLAEDFAVVLKRLGLPPVSLPVTNRTKAREREFTSYYGPEIIRRAKRVFGPYMEQWGYTFPEEWGNGQIDRWTRLEFNLLRLVRVVYWRRFRPLLHRRLRA